MATSASESLASELGDLKKLLIMMLFDRGYTQKQVALALGINQATVSRMFPKGALKPSKGRKNADGE
jgi:DNA-directed RNA polymerase specialized sigma subunit